MLHAAAPAPCSSGATPYARVVRREGGYERHNLWGGRVLTHYGAAAEGAASVRAVHGTQEPQGDGGGSRERSGAAPRPQASAATRTRTTPARILALRPQREIYYYFHRTRPITHSIYTMAHRGLRRTAVFAEKWLSCIVSEPEPPK